MYLVKAIIAATLAFTAANSACADVMNCGEVKSPNSLNRAIVNVRKTEGKEPIVSVFVCAPHLSCRLVASAHQPSKFGVQWVSDREIAVISDGALEGAVRNDMARGPADLKEILRPSVPDFLAQFGETGFGDYLIYQETSCRVLPPVSERH